LLSLVEAEPQGFSDSNAVAPFYHH
jgi:hypothetical protein